MSYFFADRVGPWLGGACLALAAVVAWPVVMTMLPTSSPPLVLEGMRFEWVAPRTLESRTDGVSRVRTCQVVLISRSFLMTDGSYVGASARIIEGQRAGMMLEPRSDLHDIVPEKTGPTVVRYEIPYWVKDPDLDQIRVFRLVQTVPDSQPCAAGYSGQHVTTVTIPRNSDWRRSHGYAVPRQTSMRR